MKSKIFIAALVAISLLQSACNKNDSNGSAPPPVTPPPSPFEKLTTSVTGKIIDEQGLPVYGAMVTAGTKTVNTDLSGSFSIQDVSLFKTGGLVSVEKNGYLTGKRSFQAEAGNLHYVNIRLIKKLAVQNFDAATGGTINVANGSTIKFEPGSVLDATTNAAYTGTVTILAQYIDPRSSEFPENMPGSMLGRTKAGVLAGTASRGILSVELTGSAGQKLKLNGDLPATFTLPIVPAEYDAAPAVLKLSALNDSTGLWQEESVALKQLNNYVGKVSHFSYWNFHLSYNYVEVKAILKTNSNVSIPHAKAWISYQFENVQAFSLGYSDTAGVVKLLLPQNATAQLTITSRCGDALHQTNIGPLGGNKTLDTIKVAYAPGTINFTGTAVDCNDNVITNGQVYITLDNLVYSTTITNGNYSLSIMRCNSSTATAHIKVVDLSNSKSKEYDQTVTTGNVTVDPITICDVITAEQYATVTYQGTTYSILPPGGEYWWGGTGYDVDYFSRDNSKGLQLQLIMPEFTNNTAPFSADGTAYSFNGPGGIAEGAARLRVNITECSPGSSYIAGSFEGKNIDDEVVIIGTFRYKRGTAAIEF